MKRCVVVVVLAAALGIGTVAASADSTPIGSLPAGPISSIEVQRGELVAIALPARTGGRVWRIARPLDGRVLRQVSEANVGRLVILVFRAKGVGATRISLALTKGDAASKALESRRFEVRVR